MTLETFFALLGIIVAGMLGAITIYLMIHLANRAENRRWTVPAFIRAVVCLPKSAYNCLAQWIGARIRRSNMRQNSSLPTVSTSQAPLSTVVIDVANRPANIGIRPPEPIHQAAPLTQSRRTVCAADVRSEQGEENLHAQPHFARWLEETGGPAPPQRWPTM